MPKISIIVPIYNAEIYLEKCIQSILNQTFKDFELILVNDGSKDNSLKICEFYSNVDSRVKIINKINGGLSSARNEGLKVSKGEYIGFVDSDDYIHPQMYEILYNSIIRKNGDIAICDYEKVYPEEPLRKMEFYNENSKNIQKYSNVAALDQFYNKYGVKFTPAWNKLYKRFLFENNKFEVGRYHEDEFIMHKLLYNSATIIYIPIKLYFYFQSQNSIMRKPFNISRLDAVDAYLDRVNFFMKIKEEKLMHKALFAYSQEFLIHYFKLEDIYPKHKKLKEMKKKYNEKLVDVLKLKYYTKKEKILLITFFFNPKIYKYITENIIGK